MRESGEKNRHFGQNLTTGYTLQKTRETFFSSNQETTNCIAAVSATLTVHLNEKALPPVLRDTLVRDKEGFRPKGLWIRPDPMRYGFFVSLWGGASADRGDMSDEAKPEAEAEAEAEASAPEAGTEASEKVEDEPAGAPKGQKVKGTVNWFNVAKGFGA